MNMLSKIEAVDTPDDRRFYIPPQELRLTPDYLQQLLAGVSEPNLFYLAQRLYGKNNYKNCYQSLLTSIYSYVQSRVTKGLAPEAIRKQFLQIVTNTGNAIFQMRLNVDLINMIIDTCTQSQTVQIFKGVTQMSDIVQPIPITRTHINSKVKPQPIRKAIPAVDLLQITGSYAGGHGRSLHSQYIAQHKNEVQYMNFKKCICGTDCDFIKKQFQKDLAVQKQHEKQREEERQRLRQIQRQKMAEKQKKKQLQRQKFIEQQKKIRQSFQRQKQMQKKKVQQRMKAIKEQVGEGFDLKSEETTKLGKKGELITSVKNQQAKNLRFQQNAKLSKQIKERIQSRLIEKRNEKINQQKTRKDMNQESSLKNQMGAEGIYRVYDQQANGDDPQILISTYQEVIEQSNHRKLNPNQPNDVDDDNKLQDPTGPKLSRNEMKKQKQLERRQRQYQNQLQLYQFHEQQQLLATKVKQQKQYFQCRHCQRFYHTYCFRRNRTCPMCFIKNMVPTQIVKKQLFVGFLKKNKMDHQINFYLDEKPHDCFFQIRCVKLTQNTQYVTLFQDSAIVSVNGVIIEELQPLHKQSNAHYRRDIPIEIPSQLLQQNNRLTILKKLEQQKDARVQYDDHVVGVFLLKHKTVRQLVKEILQRNICTFRYSKILLNASFRIGVDNLMSETLKISFICPISSQRIEIPARSIFCRHFQCFDLRNYMLIVNATTTMRWLCPICRAPCYEFIIDHIQFKILKSNEYVNDLTFGVFRNDGTYDLYSKQKILNRKPRFLTDIQKQQQAQYLKQQQDNTKKRYNEFKIPQIDQFQIKKKINKNPEFNVPEDAHIVQLEQE